MKTNAEKDLVLVNTIKSGNKGEAQKAFETLFKKYHSSVLFHYKRIANDDTLAEDLAMEAFEKMYERIETFKESNGAFSTWMFSLTKNLFIDMLRKSKKEGETVSLTGLTTYDEEGVAMEKEINSEERNAIELMEVKERNARLNEIINETFIEKPHLKELVELRYFCDKSYEEMAIITNQPIGTIKAHLHRAKILLLEACKKAQLKI